MFREKTSDSLTELYLNSYKLVYAYIFQYTTNLTVAEDISSIVWLKVMKIPERYLSMDKSKLHNYLRIMVKTAVSDYFHAEEKAYKAVERSIEFRSNSSIEENSIENELFLKSDLEVLEKAMMILTEEEKDLITLRYTDKLKCKEVAELYHIAEGALRTRQSRIYEKLRKEILRIKKESEEEYEK